jgi:hypothetical protein
MSMWKHPSKILPAPLDAKDLEGTRNQPKRDTTGTIFTPARKPQAGTRQQARHAMRSGIAGRADAGTQARQLNATPTPATALRAITDHGAPRPLRQPGLQLARGSRGHCCRDDPRALGRAGAASALARARQMNARPAPRRGSPCAPDSLAGITEAVAENGSS